MSRQDDILTAIRQKAHWRIVVRPEDYKQDRFSSRAACWEFVERHKLSLRGWDYPHIDREREIGQDWVGSSSDFGAHLEHWRVFQSAQFLHLLALREDSNEYRAHLVQNASFVFMGEQVDVEKTPGFVNILGLLYTVTEVLTFTAAWLTTQIAPPPIVLELSLNNVKDRLLVTGPDRYWGLVCRSSENVLAKRWQVSGEDLLVKREDKVIEITSWFFEGFGWMKPNTVQMRKDYQEIAARRS